MKIQDYTIDDDYLVDLRKILPLELQFKDVVSFPLSLEIKNTALFRRSGLIYPWLLTV